MDIQERLAAHMAERRAVLAATAQLIAVCRRLQVPILTTEQYPKGIGRTEPSLVEALGSAYHPLEKLAFSCCREPAFAHQLAALDRRQVVLAGMEAHICILQTGLDLLQSGHDVHVVADAVCSRNPEHKRLALDELRSAGVVVTCAEAAVYQLLGSADTPEFKELLPLLKGPSD